MDLWSRRDFLKLGLPLSLGGSILPLLPERVAPARAAGAPFLLLIYASGGWDPTMVFDNKIGVGSCAQEEGWSAAKSRSGMPFVDHPSRPAVARFFDSYGDRAAIINGISTGSMTRPEAAMRMFGGIPDKRFRRCDWLSFYAAYLNPGAEMPHVVIDAPYMPGEYAPHAIYWTSARLAELSSDPRGGAALGEAAEDAVLKFRRAMFKPIVATQNGGSLDSEKLLTLYYQFLRSEAALSRLPELLAELPKSEGDAAFALHGKLAVDLFEAGLCQCLSLQAGKDQAWEAHSEHFARQAVLYEELFSGLNQILGYAEERGILERMILIVMSERGRAPSLNRDGGKGPWPYTSALVWGTGIAGNTACGETDAWLRGLPINPAFGKGGNGAVTLEMAHVMMAIYLKTSAPGALFMPQTAPLSIILASN